MKKMIVAAGVVTWSTSSLCVDEPKSRMPSVVDCQTERASDVCKAYFAKFASHCDPQKEQIVFSCNTGRNIVSVCASRNFSVAQGYVQYRFGPIGAPALIFPESATHPSKFATGGNLFYGGGSGKYMRLPRDGYAYVIYFGAGRGWEKEGVAVEKNGKLIGNVPCELPADPSGLLAKYDFFKSFGIAEDRKGFVIP